jgi:hypothetical protein
LNRSNLPEFQCSLVVREVETIGQWCSTLSLKFRDRCLKTIVLSLSAERFCCPNETMILFHQINPSLYLFTMHGYESCTAAILYLSFVCAARYIFTTSLSKHLVKTPQGLVCILNNVSGSYICQFPIISLHIFQIRHLKLYYQTSLLFHNIITQPPVPTTRKSSTHRQNVTTNLSKRSIRTLRCR